MRNPINEMEYAEKLDRIGAQLRRLERMHGSMGHALVESRSQWTRIINTVCQADERHMLDVILPLTVGADSLCEVLGSIGYGKEALATLCARLKEGES